MKIKICRLENAVDINLPSYATLGSAGMDLYAANFESITLLPKEFKLIPTGFSIELNDFLEGQIRPRSGLALKYGISILNSPGTIDSDYRGEIGVILINHSHKPFVVKRKMKIAQLIISEYSRIVWNEVEKLDTSNRGRHGFGSTGI